MATDVARVSFDWARFYRGVVPQQGRVSLEAEQNEARVIDAGERRKELLDIVGPAGTPDDGYAISGGADFTIGAGTMYVGGLRVELDEDITFSQQPDWLDRPLRSLENLRTHEHILLMLRETDVTAVEDPALYEVALGGPDGAARTRLLQRVVRTATDAGTCAQALVQDEQEWVKEGLSFDPATMALESNSRLLVTWESDPEPADPCEPSSTGGYLGAENQLIRVQITRIDPKNGTFGLVWGYDDASFLYRVTPDASANPVLTLDRSPVDDYHRPRAGQAVQVLRAAAELCSTDGTVEGYVAALAGEVAVLTAPYDPDTKTVQLPEPLPAGYTDASRTPQLYLRVWEEQLTGLTPGTAVSLTGTGMKVTISANGTGPLHVDDFWCIAVRPSTPATVYPDRYLRTPQPPDGPRQWVCPLALIDWPDGQVAVIEDCRNHFGPLTGQNRGDCCTVEVSPSDAASSALQALLDKAAAGRRAVDRAGRVTVCFRPGRYELAEPLVLRAVHSNMTLRACSDAALIAVRAGEQAKFGQGLIVLAGADNITVSGMEFELPQVPAALAKVQASTGGIFGREAVRAMNAEVGNRYVSIGIRPVNCAVLEIDSCQFRFSLGEHTTTPEVAQTMPRDVFGVGVLAAGECWGLRLRHNRFLHDPAVPQEADRPRHYLTGYLLSQTAVSRKAESKSERSLGAARLRALLDNAEIAGNEFHGLTAAVLIDAELGDVRLWDNVIKDCYAGVWLVDAAAAANTDLTGKYQVGAADTEQVRLVRLAMAAGLLDPVLTSVLLIAALYPLPRLTGFVLRNVTHYEVEHLAQARKAAAEASQSVMTALVKQIAAEHPVQPVPAALRAQATAAERGTPAEFNAVDAPAEAALPSKNVMLAWAGLRELGRLDRPVGAMRAALQVERNSVDCAVPRELPTGPALFVYTAQEPVAATATVGSNRLISRMPTIAAAVVGPTAATVTGNIVEASGKRRFALGIAAVAAAAITGNVVDGQTVLPANRPFPVPLDTWLPLNTIV